MDMSVPCSASANAFSFWSFGSLRLWFTVFWAGVTSNP